MSNHEMGEFLTSLRKSKGYTQLEAANLLGVSNKTVSSWETGASCPDISMLPALAELYGVTCDEILRGKRIPETESETISRAKREKAMARLLEKSRTDLSTMCWTCGALTGAGAIVTLAIGCAALESLIGFFIGLIFLAASVVVGAIVTRRIKFSVSGETESGGTEKIKESLSKAMFLIVCANITAFGFIFPHAFVPVHFGYTFGYALGYGCAGAAAGLAVDLLVVYPVRLHMRKKAALAAFPSDAPGAQAENGAGENQADGAGTQESGAAIQAGGGRAQAAAGLQAALRSQKRYRTALLLFGIPLLVAAAAILSLAVAIDQNPEGMYSMYTKNFDTRESMIDFAENSELFSEYEHSLVSEESHPSDATTDPQKCRAVYLFPAFPEEWRAYYRCEDGEDGTLVTVCRYYATAAVNGEESEFSFYALNPELQGGIVDIVAETYGGFNLADGTEDAIIANCRLSYNPPLPELDAIHRVTELNDGLQWALLAVIGLYAVSLAVSVAVFLKKEKALRVPARRNG